MPRSLPDAFGAKYFGGFELRPLIRQERRDLAEFLGTLTPEQWNAESLCTGWRVRDVVAHLLHDAMPLTTYIADSVTSRMSFERMNARQVRRTATWSTGELLARLQASIDGGLGAKTLPRLSFGDLVIHHQDIRRPLGLPRDIPEDRLLAVLRSPDPFAGAPRRMKGLRVVATDVEWQHGEGPEVSGPGEAIVMALAGRGSALSELSGDGIELLRARV